MAKRVALTALLPATSIALESGNPTAPETVESARADSQSESASTAEGQRRPAAVRPVAAPAASSSSLRRNASTKTEPSGHQHYSQLIRKEARLRDDQIDGLAAQARRLSRAKNDSTERITDNTLIRVAVDLLLQHPERLSGSTEAELRKSVGL